MSNRTIKIPSLVRIKPGALDRLGIYLQRHPIERVLLLYSEGLPDAILRRCKRSIETDGPKIAGLVAVDANACEDVQTTATQMDPSIDGVVGLGGGKALDVAKHVAHLAERPMYTVPTSLSNDGFCSPQASLTQDGRRVSLRSSLPDGVVVDIEICLQAPKVLWHSGVGDLISKLTAVRDWKLAFHHDGTEVDDFAALMSDASVFQFMGRPSFDLEGMRLLATALMLNGVAMSVCGNSRPASGSEHLISHALDSLSARPRLHGLQVGVATYLVSQLHDTESEMIATLFQATGFWDCVAADPFDRAEWLRAIEIAPSMKSNFHTILSVPGQQEALLTRLIADPLLQRCFTTR